MWASAHETLRFFFTEEIAQLQNQFTYSAKLLKLASFLDKTKLLRAGGRLQQGGLPFNEKYSILMSKEARLTAALIDHILRNNCLLDSQIL